MTEIYLIRHGQAEGNTMRRLHGHYNTCLTAAGYRQAEYLKKRFETIHVDACYSSDLTRTSLTARSVYIPKGLLLHRDYRFREMGVGSWEDVPCGWLNRCYREKFFMFDKDPVGWCVPGAETFDEYTQRFIEGMIEAAQANDGGTITIFCHAAIIRRVLLRLFFWNNQEGLGYSDNTSVSKLTYHKGKCGYEFLNDASHLPPELTTAFFQKWWRESGKRDEMDLYFLPYSPKIQLPANLELPDLDSRGQTLAVMLNDNAVGIVSMAAPEGNTGRVIGMSLRKDLLGRNYGDQMLGAVFGHFKLLGCKNLVLNPGFYPDQIIEKYDIDPVTLYRSLDADAFDWGNPNA